MRAVDGCHTPLLTPFGEHKEDFTDRYARCSLLFLPISDTRLIRYFVGGFPGSRGDSNAFKERSWYRAMLDAGDTLPPLEDGEFILGDAGFALAVFLITPFREADMHGPNVASMRRFNHQHAKMRVVVENAFGRLKGRWHVLRMTYAHPQLAASVQEVCVLLHNFLEERNGASDGEALEADEEDP